MSTGFVFTTVAVSFFCVWTSGAEPIPAWALLERELVYSPPSLSQFSNSSPHFRNLLANRDIKALIEMTAQGKPLGIRLAGFEGLMALDSQIGLECGLRVALSEDPAIFPMAGMYAEIADALQNANYDKILTEAFRTMPVRAESASALIHLLPISRLEAWFEAPGRGWVVPTYEALVLGRLFADFKRQGKPPTDRMKLTLVTFADIPGIPRAKFLAETEEASQQYKRLMELSLEDDSLPDTSLRGLIAARASYIARNINLRALSLSEERRNVVQAYLDESKK